MSNHQSERHPRGNQTGQPGKSHHGSTAEETAAVNQTLIALAEKYNKNNEKNPSREIWKFRIEIGTIIGVWLYTLLTAGLLITAALQVSSSGDQTKASRGQLGIMQDTEHRQLRAYVGIVPGDVENLKIGQNPSVKLVRKNYGATPAYDVGFTVTFADVLKYPFTIASTNEACIAPRFQGLFTMFPTAELPWTINIAKTYSNEEIKLVSAGSFALVYYGNICYHDAFSIAHYTNYCWSYRGNDLTAKKAEGCLQHNDSN